MALDPAGGGWRHDDRFGGGVGERCGRVPVGATLGRGQPRRLARPRRLPSCPLAAPRQGRPDDSATPATSRRCPTTRAWHGLRA
jgi:hypothetical protein